MYERGLGADHTRGVPSTVVLCRPLVHRAVCDVVIPLYRATARAFQIGESSSLVPLADTLNHGVQYVLYDYKAEKHGFEIRTQEHQRIAQVTQGSAAANFQLLEGVTRKNKLLDAHARLSVVCLHACVNLRCILACVFVSYRAKRS